MATPERPGTFLKDLTWPEAKVRFDAGAVVVVVPVGAEAHHRGHHHR